MLLMKIYYLLLKIPVILLLALMAFLLQLGGPSPNFRPLSYLVFSKLSLLTPPPSGFNKGLLFLLPKKNSGLISDTRPLSVTNTDNRILAATVARIIMPAVADFVEPSQKGFISGRQGCEHILDVNSYFYNGLENDMERYLFFLDTAKAFDSIDHNWIRNILHHIGMPDWFLHFVNGALSNVSVPLFLVVTLVSLSILKEVLSKVARFLLLFLFSLMILFFIFFAHALVTLITLLLTVLLQLLIMFLTFFLPLLLLMTFLQFLVLVLIRTNP